jgi:hypothetical protein
MICLCLVFYRIVKPPFAFQLSNNKNTSVSSPLYPDWPVVHPPSCSVPRGGGWFVLWGQNSWGLKLTADFYLVAKLICVKLYFYWRRAKVSTGINLLVKYWRAI